LIFAYLAQQNIYWLWGSSVILILHWFTDSFDGAVGRYQNSGLVRWGYYMDHLLDFIFISSIFIGYGFLLRPDSILWLFGMIVVIGAFMANSFLAYSVLNKFRISYFKFGPTEGRIILIVLNTIIIYNGISYVENILPYVVAFFIIYMSATIYRTQKAVYKVDMDTKK
jgi:phosphatidylglycerophosphate synthase